MITLKNRIKIFIVLRFLSFCHLFCAHLLKLCLHSLLSNAFQIIINDANIIAILFFFSVSIVVKYA